MYVYIEKPTHPKTIDCLVRILVQRHNCAIFLRKWAKWGRYSQWRSLSGHVERIFVHKNLRGGYWQHLVSTGRPHSGSYTRCFEPCFWRSYYQPQSWCRLAASELNLTLLGYYLWGAVKDRCYADKLEAIDALKDNIREAIGEIQLQTIDNMFKNWTDRVGNCMASRGIHLNEIIFHY